MHPHYTPVLLALSNRGVRYLVVGGVAMVLHGVLRFTADLDLVVQLESRNVSEALEALDGLGFRPVVPVATQDFADPAKRAEWTTQRNMVVFTPWNPERPVVRVDVFVQEPFDFETAFQRRIDVLVEGVARTIVERKLGDRGGYLVCAASLDLRRHRRAEPGVSRSAGSTAA